MAIQPPGSVTLYGIVRPWTGPVARGSSPLSDAVCRALLNPRMKL